MLDSSGATEEYGELGRPDTAYPAELLGMEVKVRLALSFGFVLKQNRSKGRPGVPAG
jgi:hypothetical protein